ncbi:MAG TPA: prolyl oligopeptidase family serine peptidase [Acidimicrobiales bacterium]
MPAISTFFQDAGLDTLTKTMLGRSSTGSAEVGEVLATVARIPEGDRAAWVTEWEATADRVSAVAAGCEDRKHLKSARDAYVRAAAYYAVVVAAADGCDDPDAAIARTFAAHRRCWESFCDLLDRPPARVEIPYEGTTMPAWFFTVDDTPRPTLILSNGSDGALTSMFPGIGTDALERGYHVILFDGPGQQSLLFERGIPFRPDWEHVITPVVDWLVDQPTVDRERIAIYGISQGGYWVPRALCFEHRLVAGIADGGVDDVGATWRANLPDELLTLLHQGDKDTFDQLMEAGLAQSPATREILAWRAKPYGADSGFDLYRAVDEYRLTQELADQIRVPLCIADPDAEQFFPGQPTRLAEMLGDRSTVVRFTADEGADGHCQPMARGLAAQRFLDWLDEIVATS